MRHVVIVNKDIAPLEMARQPLLVRVRSAGIVKAERWHAGVRIKTMEMVARRDLGAATAPAAQGWLAHPH